MVREEIKTVNEFIEELPNFPNVLEIKGSSRNLLNRLYERAVKLPMKYSSNELKPPLIISFHPKASLLNNNIHETFLAVKVAKKLGMIPIWIPYIYDTGFKNKSEKIRRPTYVLFEGKYIPLRTSAAIRGNIIATERSITEKEVKTFFQELEKNEIATLNRFKTILNKFNFGHYLFNLKRSLSKFNKKTIRKKNDHYKELWLKEIKGTKKLDESLAKISVAMLNELGINVGLAMMDDILPEFVSLIFSEILITENVKKDPSLLEDLFVAYDIKNRERTPILCAGGNNFIAFNDNSVRVFDGDLQSLVNGLKNHTVLPTGNLIILLFCCLGCRLVLGGSHTVEYYPDYFKKTFSILNETSFNSKMQLLSYGKIRFIDLRNMTDIMSAIRIFDKVGSRNYIQKGHFTVPRDIVDHLNFLAGSTEVPLEYKEILEKLMEGQKNNKPHAVIKEQERYEEVLNIIAKTPEELLKDPSTLKKWIRGTKFEGLHPVRLEIMLENLRLDVEMRLRMLKENFSFEQHILGGTLEDEEEGEILYDGIVIRSNRYPTLLELVYYDSKPQETFEIGGTLEDHESEWIWKHFIHDITTTSRIDEKSFSNYESVFKDLIPNHLIVNPFKY